MGSARRVMTRRAKACLSARRVIPVRDESRQTRLAHFHVSGHVFLELNVTIRKIFEMCFARKFHFTYTFVVTKYE